MFADTVQHVFLSPLYALAKYFENRGRCHATRDSVESILRARQTRRTRCSSHPIEATACGIVAGLRGLELQTNAITTPFASLYADRVPRIYRPVIEIPTLCRDIREHLPRSNFLSYFYLNFFIDY